MNIALNSSSHNLETTLLSYGNNTNSPPTSPFIHPSVRHSTREASRSLSPQHQSSLDTPPNVIALQEVSRHDNMEQEIASAASLVLNYDPQRAQDYRGDLSPAQEIDGQNHERIDIDMEDSGDIIDIPPTPPPPPRSGSNTPVAEQIDAAVLDPPDNHHIATDLERSGTNSTSEITPEEDGEEDTEDDSSYDDDNGFWATYQEDTSGPSDEELQEIGRRTEISALDHEHWEKITFDKVSDPEYTVNDVGRISWTVRGFHGTKENPNKERILRSPSVSIGGFKWNIKLLPRGDETTDQVSVYIECTGSDTGYNSDFVKELNPNASVPISSDEVLISHTKSNQGHIEQNFDGGDSSVNVGENAAKISTSQTTSGSIVPPVSPWDVAAQIGCVMYNPNEPRVRVHEKSAHHFENGSTDWGWVRFHGPWNVIHQRQHLQRQALLRDDTVCFTAYIRTFNDPTRALWWHVDKQNRWDSLQKTGYRGMIVQDPDENALAAALSAWMHLAPFRDTIMKTSVPQSALEPTAFVRPLFYELKKLLQAKFSADASGSAISLDYLVALFDWYDWELPAHPDVIEIWETLQNLLNEEYYNVGDGTPAKNILHTIVTFRQIDYSRFLADSGFLSGDRMPVISEPRSTQQVLDSFMERCQTNNKLWSKVNGVSGFNSCPPSVLQLELHRQDYDIKARKWKRLTHRIEIDETVIYKSQTPRSECIDYTLYGIIVHAGKLGSGDYYAVTRPGGPGSQWVQFGGVGQEQSYVTYLTTQQAVQAHEGDGEGSEDGSPVAYIAIYLRSESLGSILPEAQEAQLSPPTVRGALQAESIPHSSTAKEVGSTVVQIFDSALFMDWEGRGIMDPVADNNDHILSGKISSLEVPPSTTFRELRKILIHKLGMTERPNQFWLFGLCILPVPPLDRNRLVPAFSNLRPDETLESIRDYDGVCRLWLHILPTECVQTSLQQPSLLDTAMNDHAQVATVEEQLPSESEPSMNIDDVVMGGTQDQAPEGSKLDGTCNKDDFWEINRLATYFFVKRFDQKQQRLYGVGSYIALRNELIGELLERYGLVPIDENYELYSESKARLRKLPISPTTNFCDADIYTGDSIIIVERLTREEYALPFTNANLYRTNIPNFRTKALVAEGKSTNIGRYYRHLESLVDPNYQQPRWTSCFFGSLYVSAENKCGPANGHCIRIETFGDAYFGNCVLGVYSGHGTMYYANGDTYAGEWDRDLPNGQGTMVYGKTGNVYTGGWRNGKRHGKGTMHFEVADEDLEICRICYEAEMDALFFRCGHVAACEECAKQVKDCPVCRKPVDAVVKIYKT